MKSVPNIYVPPFSVFMFPHKTKDITDTRAYKCSLCLLQHASDTWCVTRSHVVQENNLHLKPVKWTRSTNRHCSKQSTFGRLLLDHKILTPSMQTPHPSNPKNSSRCCTFIPQGEPSHLGKLFKGLEANCPCRAQAGDADLVLFDKSWSCLALLSCLFVYHTNKGLQGEGIHNRISTNT